MARRRVLGLPEEVASGLSFCVTSAAMTLLNKAVLSSFHFTAPTTLLCFQCTISLLLVVLASFAGYGQLPSINLRLLWLWLPVNILFVGMVWTSFYALRNLGVAMVTVLKNLTNFLVIFGDLLIFNKRYSSGVWATLVLMLVSALCSAATDLAFDASGYTWQMINNTFTAAYSLWLRAVITKMSVITHKQGGTDEFGMVVFNNLLSIPMIAALIFITGEAWTVAKEPALKQPAFLLAAASSGIIGFLISIASMWFLSCTTATTFSLVGSLNKIPLAVLGMLLFKAPTSTNNLISVMVGLLAGAVFAHAKSRDAAQARQAKGGENSSYGNAAANASSSPAARKYHKRTSSDASSIGTISRSNSDQMLPLHVSSQRGSSYNMLEYVQIVSKKKVDQ
jgi:GDP-mannose transporter